MKSKYSKEVRILKLILVAIIFLLSPNIKPGFSITTNQNISVTFSSDHFSKTDISGAVNLRGLHNNSYYLLIVGSNLKENFQDIHFFKATGIDMSISYKIPNNPIDKSGKNATILVATIDSVNLSYAGSGQISKYYPQSSNEWSMIGILLIILVIVSGGLGMKKKYL